MDRGRILDPVALGGALRQLLARSEITTSRALIAASDSIASFRVLTFPDGTTDDRIDAAVKAQLPTVDPRLAVRRMEVVPGRPGRTIYATVWDSDQVRVIAETARHAGLDPAVVDLKSLCIARAVPVASCIVLDMSAEPIEVILIDDHIPRVWHSFTMSSDGDLANALNAGLKPVVGYYRTAAGGAFPADAPILIRSDQAPPSLMASRLTQLSGHPVGSLPQPARIDPELRFGPYLACVGLVMRRRT